MCGIAGFAAAPGQEPPSEALIEAMTATIVHRGPDGGNVFVEGAVGLGHRRLAIIDVSGGDNPLIDADGRAALVFNGEIYNHRALRAELEASGSRPRTGSDGEVLLHGYLTWGLLGMLRRVRGMFAMALLDRVSGELHLARDPLGIKPLFVAVSPRGLAFGSEIKALLPALPARPELDQRGLLQCLSLGYTIAPTTMYAGVSSLQAGDCATWRDGELRYRRHHDLVFEPGSEPDDPDALWEQVTRAVDSHLMSEVPLGAFLSGGVDSSAVVAAMSQVSGGRIDAVSVGVQGDDLDEREHAREVANRLDVQLHEETAESDLLELLPRLAWHLEAPFADTSAAPTWVVCQAARRHVTVALSGDGGDENFAGYRRTRFDVLEERLRRRIPGPLRRGLLGPLGRLWPRGRWVPGPLRAGTLLTNLGGDWLDAWQRSVARIPEEAARALLHPDLEQQPPLRADLELSAFRAGAVDPLSRVQFMDFSHWLADDILVKVDRMSMAHSLEVRVPLLDTDFVEYAARLPEQSKLAHGRGKALFRRSLRGRIPDSVLDRPKQGFHLPVGTWLRGEAKPVLDQLLVERDGPAFAWLDHGRLAKAAAQHAAGSHDRSTELWFLVMLDAFLRHGPGGSEG